MGMIGRWIDTLGAAEQDSIITHPDPAYDGSGWWDRRYDCGCLVGCVIGRDAASDELLRHHPAHGAALIPLSILDTPAVPVGLRFPDLTFRFTPERMWRLVKARAAKGHRSPLTTASVQAQTGAPNRLQPVSEGTHTE